jgi:hypothetical protein
LPQSEVPMVVSQHLWYLDPPIIEKLLRLPDCLREFVGFDRDETNPHHRPAWTLFHLEQDAKFQNHPPWISSSGPE